MIAGPNGSGKSELFKNLALERSRSGVFHGGPFVNADELEEQWRTVRAIDLAPFPITSSTEELRAWMRGSPWAARVSRLVEKIECQSGALRMPHHAAHSYFAAALADYLREKTHRCRALVQLRDGHVAREQGEHSYAGTKPRLPNLPVFRRDR